MINTQNQFYNTASSGSGSGTINYQQQQQQQQYFIMSKISPPGGGNSYSPPSQSQSKTPVKKLFCESTLLSTQSPLSIHSFKLGTIPHQSSPYLNLQASSTTKFAAALSATTTTTTKGEEDDDDDDEYDYEKPKVFQDEDCVVAEKQQSATATATIATLASITSKCDSLNISSPTCQSHEASFVSSQTKSSLKSTATSLSTASSTTTNVNNKHVKFRTATTDTGKQLPPETPIMFSRCSSMTSLNSFDAKSIHSSVASEYSRRPSGIMSPSELPDSPDESYVMSLRQQQQQYSFMGNKSNEITMIERTMILKNGGSSSNSEKNSFYNRQQENNNNNDDGDSDIPFLKDNTTAYDVEGSPWRHGAHSEVSSLSALTFNDDQSERGGRSNNKDIAAILSLLQTRSKENKAAAAAGLTTTQQHQQQQQQFNFNALSFTPPIKLPAAVNKNNTIKSDQPEYCFFSSTTPAPGLSVDIPKLYCDEYTPSNISPQSMMSELSVPSLIKQEIGETQVQKSQYDALFKRMSFQPSATNAPSSCIEIVDLDVPKVYETEDGGGGGSSLIIPKQQQKMVERGNYSVTSHFLQQQCSVDTDSPKVFLTEDTPMCYSRSSSLNSLNNDTSVNRTAINVNTNAKSKQQQHQLDDDDDTNNKSASLLLSDSCHKPTNTPANPVNMSRGSYSSPNDSSSENDEDNKENIEEEDEEEEEDSKKEDIIIKQFINQTMPVTMNKQQQQHRTLKKIATVSKTPTTSNNSNLEGDDDEILLQNFIKEMLPPVPTRKSTSKLPVYSKRLSVNEERRAETPTKATSSAAMLMNKSKKRLSEENPGVHSHKIQQQNRNFSFCYNLATAAAVQNAAQQLPPQSPKLTKKPASTLYKGAGSSLNRSRTKFGVTQTASTYSLSTIATSTSSSSTNSVTANQHHTATTHPPVVNMTRTTQLRASKVAAETTKSTQAVRKATTTNNTNAATTSTTTRQSLTKTQQQQQKAVANSKPPPAPPTVHIPKATTDHQVESISGGTNCINRRKSFHGAPLKKQLQPTTTTTTTTTTKCTTNENQIATTKHQHQQPVKQQAPAPMDTTTTTSSKSNVLKKANLNKLNK